MNTAGPIPARWFDWKIAAIAFFAYFTLATSSIAISRIPDGIAIIWICNAVAVAICIVRGRASVAATLAGSIIGGLLANIAMSNPIAVSIYLMLANGVEIGIGTLLAFYMLKRCRPAHKALDFLLSVLGLASLPALAGGLIAAVLLTAPVYDGFFNTLFVWWSSSAMGIIAVIPPVALYLRRGVSVFYSVKISEMLLLFTILILITIVAIYARYPFAIISVIMILLAIRFRPLVVSLFSSVFIGVVSAVSGFYGSALTESSFDLPFDHLGFDSALAVMPAIYLSIVLEQLTQEKQKADLNEEMSQQIMDHSPIGMALVDSAENILRANQALAEMLGYTQGELATMTLKDVTHPDDRTIGAETFGRLIAGNIPSFRVEKRFLRRDGTSFHALAAGSFMHAGPAGGACTILQVDNIDLMKRYQAEIEAQEQRWHFALEAAGQGVWDADLVTRTCYYSPTWCSMLGYSQEEVGNEIDGWLAYVHPDDRDRARATGRDHLANHTPYFELEYRVRHKDGRQLWILDRGRVVDRDSEGRPLRYCGIYTDISATKEAEQVLRDLKERMELAVEAGDVGIWHWNPQTGETVWDARTYAIYGRDPETFETTHESWIGTLHPDERENILEALHASLRSAHRLKAEFRVVTPEGEERHIRTIAKIIRDDQGNAELVLGTNWDFTEYHRIVTDLRDANERLRQFAYIASHDMQGPLRHIVLHCQMLKAELADSQDGNVGDILEIIVDRSQHLQELISGLLAFSKAADSVPVKDVDLDVVIKRAKEICGAEIAADNCILNVVPLPLVAGVELLLTQVFQNLISNAIKYRSEADPIIDISSRICDGSAFITVADNGIGIDPRYKDYIFELFKRIPAAHRATGTGIGLALCRKILSAMKGEIWLEPKTDGGSSFVIRLPLSSASDKHDGYGTSIGSGAQVDLID